MRVLDLHHFLDRVVGHLERTAPKEKQRREKRESVQEDNTTEIRGRWRRMNLSGNSAMRRMSSENLDTVASKDRHWILSWSSHCRSKRRESCSASIPDGKKRVVVISECVKEKIAWRRSNRWTGVHQESPACKRENMSDALVVKLAREAEFEKNEKEATKAARSINATMLHIHPRISPPGGTASVLQQLRSTTRA